MLTAIEINNFKSAEKLDIEFARVNVFIGENGSGKSTILEAITFAAAAEADRLDTEFLANRGIRVPAPQFMRSNFSEDTVGEPIEIKVSMQTEDQSKVYRVDHSNETYAEWQVKIDTKLENKELSLLEISAKFAPLKTFVIYSPQNKQLRNLTEEGSIRPVGIHGEGLFKLLREIHAKQPAALKDIEAGLSLIGWYKSMDLDNEPELAEDELFIQDKFLLAPFTQRSANEGFLYVLFYMALIVSKDTPKIFAIDNIDAALNPKLCAKITSYLVELAKKYDKQLFLTTQNPATLDGIDLFDEAQKLFVVSRKRSGQTTAREFTADRMPKQDNGELVMLSEAMIRGYIGGIPKGF